MTYITTPDLGLELADPTTVQAFETTNVNSNFLLLEAGIVADRVRLTAEETKSATQLAGPGRGTIAQWAVASLAALDAISTALIGDEAMFTADPSTGISSTGAGLKAQAFSGSGASIKWHFSSPIIAATLSNMNTFIAACVAITDLATAFIVGQTFYVSGTGISYVFTSSAGAYKPLTSNLIVTQTSTGGTVAVDAFGRVTFSGAVTSMRVNTVAGIAELADFSMIEVTFDVDGGSGVTGSIPMKLANGATVDSTASSYVGQRAVGASTSTAAAVDAAASTGQLAAGAARRYHRHTLRMKALGSALPTVIFDDYTAFDASVANLLVGINTIVHNVSSGFNGAEFTFTSMGALANGLVSIKGIA